MYRIKPVGFWVSVGSAWEDWCRSEEFALDSLAHKSKVDICHDSVLSISEIDQFHDFFDQYGRSDTRENSKIGIDFMGHIWLYGWDCSSGCIWDKEAIKSIEEVY